MIDKEPQQTLENTSKNSTKPFEVKDLSPEIENQAKRGWTITINNQELDIPITSAALENKQMGIDVNYGQRPEGYDGMIITENGGGAVTIPYMIDADGNVFIGVVKEYRPALGGDTLNIPRGFLDAGETHKETAVRELAEETGFRAMGSRMVTLAQGLNPNSTYFNTSKSDEDGVSMFAVKIEPDELELTHDEKGNVFYAFPAHVRTQAEQDKTAERILGSEFIPLAQALKSRDMFTSAATGQLLSHLLSEGEYLTLQKSAQTTV